jgi:hypothetical protein
MSEPAAALRRFGALADVALAEQFSPRTRAAAALSAELAHDAQLRPLPSTGLALAPDVAVDRLFADLSASLQLAPPCNLRRALFVAQLIGHRIPFLLAELALLS